VPSLPPDARSCPSAEKASARVPLACAEMRPANNAPSLTLNKFRFWSNPPTVTSLCQKLHLEDGLVRRHGSRGFVARMCGRALPYRSRQLASFVRMRRAVSEGWGICRRLSRLTPEGGATKLDVEPVSWCCEMRVCGVKKVAASVVSKFAMRCERTVGD